MVAIRHLVNICVHVYCICIIICSTYAYLFNSVLVGFSVASRGFSIAAPSVWNSLPVDSHACSLPHTFLVFLKPTALIRPSVPPSGSHKCLRFGLWLSPCTKDLIYFSFIEQSRSRCFEFCHFVPNSVLQMLLSIVISCMQCTITEILCETAGISIINLLLHYVAYDADIKTSIAVVIAGCVYDYLWCLLLQRV